MTIPNQPAQSPAEVVSRLQARLDEVERAYIYDTAALKRRIAELEAANKRVVSVGSGLGSALAARTEDLMRAETRVAELEKRLHDAAMARVWTNEDGKKFVFADDLKGPLLGVVEPKATP
ncbi:hypothetical protein [Streptomyces sp. NRRL B-24720]|uniref:hypothetical protein n=1 Tax=Streptomyces sp. NRRL B-24720 TaxID=1476876 RepID=UPI0004C4BF28|nr:hypothetical protein [Streptomyces sp. NRRL B-24720]